MINRLGLHSTYLLALHRWCCFIVMVITPVLLFFSLQVLRSIGYRTLPIEGVPFDSKLGTIPNTAGRIKQGKCDGGNEISVDDDYCQ